MRAFLLLLLISRCSFCIVTMQLEVANVSPLSPLTFDVELLPPPPTRHLWLGRTHFRQKQLPPKRVATFALTAAFLAAGVHEVSGVRLVVHKAFHEGVTLEAHPSNFAVIEPSLNHYVTVDEMVPAPLSAVL